MKKNIRRLFLIPVLLLAALSIQAGSPKRTPPAATPPPPPDFTNVSDILGGRRTLFPVDDLLVTYQNQNQSIVPISAYTSNGSIGNTNASAECDLGSTVGYVSGIGRMFNLPYAVEVVVSGNQFAITEMNAMGSQPCGNQHFFSNPVGGTPASNQFPQGDFTGDGYTDFAVLIGNTPYLFTATDVNNLAAGAFWSEAGAPPLPNIGSAALAAGDFDGNGDDELAMISTPADLSACQSGLPCIHVTVYDARVTSSNGQLQSIQLVTVGSTQFAVAGFNCVAGITAAAGAFSGATNPDTGILQDQLLIGYQAGVIINETFCPPVQLVLASINATTQSSDPLALELSLADQLPVATAGQNNVSLTSARLDFFAPTEQVVLAAADVVGFGNNNSLAVVVMDPALDIEVASTQAYGGGDVNLRFVQTGVAVGNFDQETGPDNPLALEIATFGWEVVGGVVLSGDVALFRVDPGNNFALSTPSDGGSVAPVQDGRVSAVNFETTATIASGDLQGRSLLLGEPTKLTVEHVQPQLVLGMPPMHADWVTPVDGTGPEVLNLSAILGTFYSSYQNSASTAVSSTNQHTTSWTHAVSLTVTEGFRWGNAATGSVNVNASQSAGYMHNKTVANLHSSSDSSTFTVSVATGFDDSVWYSDVRHNIYSYPVIGQTACPEGDGDNCSASDRVPLTVIFSGPDQIQKYVTGGSTLEWFHPVWEPGNVLSYPGNFDQLESQYPAVDLLTSQAPTDISTNSEAFTATAGWTATSGSSSTSGTTTNISWGTSLSVSRTPPKATGGFSGSVSASYNGSKAISSLNTSTTRVDESVGVGINLPGTFPDPDNYQYGIGPFIFGDGPADGTPQGNLFTPCSATVTENCIDALTQGIQHAAFSTDLPSNSWWQGAYFEPDLALNHPERWNVATGSVNTGPECVETGNSGRPFSCATFNAFDQVELDTKPAYLWTSGFFWMKGLLITPAAAAADGPQITQAAAGDPVRLQARVYNYSLAPMNDGSQIVVQFYGQPWQGSCSQGDSPCTPNTPIGDSFLIENVTLGPIPAFGSGSANWAVAETTQLDTAAHADQHLIFWVLVVYKDADGKPLPEMPGHGLTGVPPQVKSIVEAATWLEYSDSQTYSNNLGYYHSVFYIAPKTAAASPAETGGTKGRAKAKAGKGDLTLKRFAVEPRSAEVNEKVSVSVLLQAGEEALDGVAVSFYDGDPKQGGQLFDVEHITHIRANEAAEARVPFRAARCGVHTLYVETHPEVKTAKTMLNVRIRPAAGGAEAHRPDQAAGFAKTRQGAFTDSICGTRRPSRSDAAM